MSPNDDEIQQNAILRAYEVMEAEGPIPCRQPARCIKQLAAPVSRRSYTVFGEVLEGMDVVDAIANTATDLSDKPVKDIRILKVKIIK
jgi:cyclophilin family peptidyl-prolyl cis-trans isomerase